MNKWGVNNGLYSTIVPYFDVQIVPTLASGSVLRMALVRYIKHHTKK